MMLLETDVYEWAELTHRRILALLAARKKVPRDLYDLLRLGVPAVERGEPGATEVLRLARRRWDAFSQDVRDYIVKAPMPPDDPVEVPDSLGPDAEEAQEIGAQEASDRIGRALTDRAQHFDRLVAVAGGEERLSEKGRAVSLLLGLLHRGGEINLFGIALPAAAIAEWLGVMFSVPELTKELFVEDEPGRSPGDEEVKPPGPGRNSEPA
jgi:hypothetical protein